MSCFAYAGALLMNDTGILMPLTLIFVLSRSTEVLLTFLLFSPQQSLFHFLKTTALWRKDGKRSSPSSLYFFSHPQTPKFLCLPCSSCVPDSFLFLAQMPPEIINLRRDKVNFGLQFCGFRWMAASLWKNLGGFCVLFYLFCFVPDGSLLAPAGLDCTM